MKIIKLFFDKSFALTLLIIFSPLFILLSIFIYFDLGKPILFKQKRIGKNNEQFIMYKFRTMKKGTPDIATHLLEKKDYDLPEFYFFEGEELKLADGLDHFHTDGLIILHNGKMLFEQYWHGNTKDSKHIAFSVSKSYLSALFGIAIDEGLIDSIDDKVSKYLDDFDGTGNNGERNVAYI